MKKIFLTIMVLFTVMFNAFGQNSIYFWCEQLDNDYQTLFNYKNMYGNKTKKWAYALSDTLGVDDNKCVSHSYVIQFPEELNTDKIINTTIEWVNYKFSSAESAIKSIDRDNDVKTIIIHGSLGIIAQQSFIDLFYSKKVLVKADIDIVIKIKDNRLKITSMVKDYNYISGDSFMTGKNLLVKPGEAYPFDCVTEDIKGLCDETVLCLSYINSNANTIGICIDYKDFMNKEFNKITIIDEDENW